MFMIMPAQIILKSVESSRNYFVPKVNSSNTSAMAIFVFLLLLLLWCWWYCCCCCLVLFIVVVIVVVFLLFCCLVFCLLLVVVFCLLSCFVCCCCCCLVLHCSLRELVLECWSSCSYSCQQTRVVLSVNQLTSNELLVHHMKQGLYAPRSDRVS